jgi:GH35 family endo-1,4-beta-xylanase
MSERAKQVLKYFEEQKDFFNARVQSGIELYRKGTARIRVVDEEGNPVKGAVIEAKETKQDFKFGANTFMIDELETEEKNEIYKKKFPELFNLGTIPFYWQDLEPEEGKPRFAADSPKIYRRPATDLCVDYCLANGIEPKLHCLNYDQFAPEWVKNRSIKEIKEALVKRFREIGERYAKIIPMIEVTNETYCKHPNGSEFFFSDDFCDWSFREAQKYFPGNELIINEAYLEWEAPNAHTNRNPYYQQVEKLLRDGAPVHSIGCQYHSFVKREDEVSSFAKPDGRYAPEYMFAVMDKLSELNLPLQITEITIPAYSWEEEDEAVQAQLLEYVYKMFFAQKNMEAIIYWNLPDGYAYRAEPGDMTCGENYYHGGLLRFDMSEKPGFKVLKKLIREEWMTNTQVVTDEDGYATLRGFHGEYELTVNAGDKNAAQAFHMTKSDLKNSATITLK